MISVSFYEQAEGTPLLAQVMLPEAPVIGDEVGIRETFYKAELRAWIIGKGAPHELNVFVRKMEQKGTEATKG